MTSEDGYPELELSNSVSRLKVYVPDPVRGFYRGTRFDHSGLISSLRHEDREFFGLWRGPRDPELHDHVCGPAEEYLCDGSALGYAAARPGETFVKIGVGELVKGDEAAYPRFGKSRFAHPGVWSFESRGGQISFRHLCDTHPVWKYRLSKTLRLGEGSLSIGHRFENLGAAAAFDVYNHNFFMIDQTPAGPSYRLEFPFRPRLEAEASAELQVDGKVLRYAAEIPEGQSAHSFISGFEAVPEHHWFKVVNARTGSAVEVSCPLPLSDFNFWSVRPTLCPEPFLHFDVPAGGAVSWDWNYTFHAGVPDAGAR